MFALRQHMPRLDPAVALVANGGLGHLLAAHSRLQYPAYGLGLGRSEPSQAACNNASIRW